MATRTIAQPIRSDFARRLLQADGLFEIIVGAPLIVAAGPAASFLGPGAPLPVALIGAGLLLYAAQLFWSAARTPVDPRAVRDAGIVNAVGALGGAIVLFAGWLPLTTGGRGWSR